MGEVVPMPTLPVPLGLRRMLPVVSYAAELPRVRLLRFVVDIFPFPSMNVATPAIVPEILAVGVPLFTLMNANLAEAVESEPIKTSTVLFLG